MIDSLKIKLPLLRDSAQVDCLNALGFVYTYLLIDTAKSYAQKAYNQASTINYARGMAMSLNNSARIAGHGLHDFRLQQKISKQTIQLYANGTDKKILTDAYMNLALALFCQSDFDQSEKVCVLVSQLSQRGGNKKSVGEALAVLGLINLEQGNYKKSFEYFIESLSVFESINDSYNTAILLAKIGDLYRLAGDHKTSLNFYFQSLQYAKGPSLQWHPLADLGDMYYSIEPSDSTSTDNNQYGQSIKSLTIRSNDSTFPRIRSAEVYISRKEYDKAIALLEEDLRVLQNGGFGSPLMRVVLDLARAYEGKKHYERAFHYTKYLLRDARKYKANQYVQDGYKLMYMLFDQLHKIDSAYFYFRKYAVMKDSIALDDFVKKLAIYKVASENEKKEAQIELLNSEKQISQQQLQLNEQQLKSASFQKRVIVGGVFILVLLAVIIFRNVMLRQRNEAHRHEIVEQELNLQKLESERAKSEHQQQATELEMQALRAQMNPHFIFNSLNSINRFILQNNKAMASEHLTKFSKLVRLILQNSQVSLIPLETELEALQIYIELEAVRFDNHFDFKINIEEELDLSAIKVPPLIIQPYVENAIWHGLMHKEQRGRLEIVLSQKGELLCCKITDDGIGRKKAAELKSKSASPHKSLGMQITADRIAVLHKKKQNESFITITDLVLPDGSAAGTEVFLQIPIQYD